MKQSIFIPLVLVAAATVGFCSCSQHPATNSPILRQQLETEYVGSALYMQRVSEFELLPVTNNDIVFVGNSLISRGEWNELLKNPLIKNRGISGDTTHGVLDRIDMVALGKPAMIFLLAGINDIASGITSDVILQNMASIVNRIYELSPDTKVFIQSLLPVGPSFKPFVPATIPIVNEGYRNIAERTNSVFIDLFPYFADSDGHLLPSLTNDDLHLMGKGYIIWATILAPYIDPSIEVTLPSYDTVSPSLIIE